MLINIQPLIKYRDYRLLYLGQFISAFGNMLTYVALPYQIYHLTNSSLAVGNIGLVQLFPLLFTSLWGGALADKVNRKVLLLSAEFGMFITSVLLLMNTLFVPHMWLIYLMAGIGSACNGFHRPALEAITQQLVPKDEMSSVAALGSLKYGVAMIIGPSIAGILLAKYGVAPVYCFDIASYVVSFACIFFIKTPLIVESTVDPIFRSIKEGVRYAMSRQELLGSYAIDFVAMIFGMPLALFPAIAETFHDTSTIGWLYAAPSVGMLLSVIFSGWTQHIKRHGIAITISAALWGIAIIGFGFSSNLWLALFFLVVAGGADAFSGVFRTTLWNQTIPQNYRGRLAGIEMISYMSGPLLGNAEAGLVAASFGTTFSVVSGGVLCLVSIAILICVLPKFRRYKAD